MTSICFVVTVIMSFPLSFSALKHYFCFLIQIILTQIRDCSCKKKDRSATTNTHLIDKEEKQDPSASPSKGNISNSTRGVHNTTQHKVETIKSEVYNTKYDETSEIDDEVDDDHEDSHHHLDHYVQLPDWVTWIIIFLLFVSIFYVANKYQQMKKVNAI
jgi:hypothetical protein